MRASVAEFIYLLSIYAATMDKNISVGFVILGQIEPRNIFHCRPHFLRHA